MLATLRPFGGPDRLWVRNLLRWKLSRIDGISSYYSLYDIPGEVLHRLDLPARRSIFGRSGGGNRRSIIDEAYEGAGVFIRDYNTPEDQAFDELESALERGETLFNLIYTAELDSDLHSYGPGDDAIGTRLMHYAARIDSLVSRFPDVRFAVLGDHGMCEVKTRIDLISAVDAAGLRIQEDFIPFYDSTMARFHVRSVRAASVLSALLNGTDGGRILDNEELRSLGVYFPEGDYGDIVFLCDPGAIILPSYMSSDPVKGMHGYHPEAPCMDSVMFSSEEYGREEASITAVATFLMPGFKGGERRR